METLTFNRHQYMTASTRKEILDLISDLEIIENCKQNRVINYLYGSFDGYNYSKQILNDSLLVELENGGNSHLVERIKKITNIINSYPTEEN